MKTRLTIAFALAVLSVTPAFSQQSQLPPLISVSGTSEVKVAPDEIFLRFSVDSRDAILEAAKKQNDASVSNALAFLKSKGVADKDVQTDFIDIDPAYDDYSSRKVKTYVVRKFVGVRLTDTRNFEAILTGLLNSGVNNVHGMELRSSEMRKHRDTARAMAIRAAREKADAIAAELGVRRGKVYSVDATEAGATSGGWRRGFNFAASNSSMNAGGLVESGEGTLAVGQIPISASVEVSFLIE
jgi:uncharacterized protein YggE